jgi:hypothetical protein
MTPGSATSLSPEQAQQAPQPPQDRKTRGTPNVRMWRIARLCCHSEDLRQMLRSRKARNLQKAAIVADVAHVAAHPQQCLKVEVVVALKSEVGLGRAEVENSNEQSHATGQSGQRTSLRGQDKIRSRMSVPGRQRPTKMQDARWNQQGSSSGQSQRLETREQVC